MQSVVSLASASPVAGRYLHWGVIQISVTNLALVALMTALFVLAIVLPFPGRGRSRSGRAGDGS